MCAILNNFIVCSGWCIYSKPEPAYHKLVARYACFFLSYERKFDYQRWIGSRQFLTAPVRGGIYGSEILCLFRFLAKNQFKTPIMVHSLLFFEWNFCPCVSQCLRSLFKHLLQNYLTDLYQTLYETLIY